MATEASNAIHERHVRKREEVRAVSSFDAWVAGEPYVTGQRVETRDPVIDEPITEVPVCGTAAVDDAVAAAWDAYNGDWAETTPTERSRLLFEWVDELRDHLEELTLLECLDTGKRWSVARGEVEEGIATVEYYASVCRGQTGETMQANDDLHLYTRHEPYGVVGQITPWNFPLWAAGWKFGPALAAGNACVLKPSAVAPLSTIRMAELSKGILPDGVVNVVTGTGSTTGAALTEHDDVRKVSFTGSTAVGEQVMKAAAEHVAPVTLELGGKSPFVIFPDADLDKVVAAAANGVFHSTGEICDALSRVFVHEDVAAEFTDRLVDVAESHVLGDPLEEETTMGPLTSRDQFETVTEYVEVGQQEGATLATGGGTPTDSALEDGWYVEPTVFTDVTNDMRIAREEIFGPVQTVQTFSTYDEAIELANDTRYGLAAAVGTEQTDRVHRAAADLEAGVIYVNEYGPILPEAPHGGMKDSGVGRDLGQESMEHYQQTKTVYVNLGDPST